MPSSRERYTGIMGGGRTGGIESLHQYSEIGLVGHRLRGLSSTSGGSDRWRDCVPRIVTNVILRASRLKLSALWNTYLAEPGEDYASLVLEGVHAELSFSECHDADDGSATCGISRAINPSQRNAWPMTQDNPHSVVTCSGCHDRPGLPTGWNEEQEKGDAFIGGDPQLDDEARPFSSNFLVLAVDCGRCHAPGDHPWDL